MSYLHETIKAYERSFEDYKNRKAGKSEDSYPLLERFISLLPGNKVLEVGFGLGQDAKFLIDHGFSYTGIDPVPHFYNHLRDTLPNAGIYMQEVTNTNFPPKSFDGIWAMAVFLHLEDSDLISTVEKCHDWLTPNGLLYVSTKEGEGNLRRDGKFFNLFTKERFLSFTNHLFTLEESHFTHARSYNTGKENWLNFYLRKKGILKLNE